MASILRRQLYKKLGAILGSGVLLVVAVLNRQHRAAQQQPSCGPGEKAFEPQGESTAPRRVGPHTQSENQAVCAGKGEARWGERWGESARKRERASERA